MINYELLAALSQMVPGQPLQLHPPEENRPAIVVHICDEADPVNSLFPNLSTIKIPQTQRPPVKCASSSSESSQSNPSNQSATA